MSSVARSSRVSAIVTVLAVGVMLATALLAAFRVGSGGIALPSLSLPGGGLAQSSGAAALSQYVTRLVRVRNAPTSSGFSVFRTLGRGVEVSGVWVTGADGKTLWLRVTEPNGTAGFIWGKNLASEPRPALESAAEQDLTALQRIGTRSEPEENSMILDTVPAGAKLHSVGTVSGGVYEIAIETRGVGYVSGGTVFETAAAGATAVASFNCTAASTWDEKFICSDQAVATADLRLAALYANSMSSAGSNEARKQLRSAQRAWIRQRKTCESTTEPAGCMRNLYQARARALGSAVSLF